MLPKIAGLPLIDPPAKDRRLVADLICFDGPLLSYFQDEEHHHYLYYWCDVDELYNRWLITVVNERLLGDFLAGQVTLRELLLEAGHQGVDLADLDSVGHSAQILRVNLSDLPDSYLPDDESWYDASLSVFHDQLAVRDLMTMMQSSLQETQKKLKLIEQIVTRGAKVTSSVSAISG